MTDIIYLKDINKSYGEGSTSVTVLKDFSLSVKSCEILAITGPSGAGKSTLMHIMSGLEKPSSGSVLFEGEDISKFSAKELDVHRNRNVGFVFQFHYLIDDFTAVENVMLAALLAGIGEQAARDKAAELLSKVGLADRLNHLPKELSGGEQQRCAVARALINEPKVIFADEPTGNLDKANSDIVEKLLFGLKKHGVTVILVTHDISLANKCDRHIKLEKA